MNNREWLKDDVVESFRLKDGTFPCPTDSKNNHGDHLIAPWCMRFNEYIVDDFGNLLPIYKSRVFLGYMVNDSVYYQYAPAHTPFWDFVRDNHESIRKSHTEYYK